MNFSTRLVKWYEVNKRELPWRDTQDPYKVWLSEVVLQQTRVNQGMDYYLKLLSLFPTVKKLADADEDRLLKAWQGLGYYSRARNLHRTARYIAYELNGEFPTTRDELQKLKGIGPYTSAAIASFCFDEKVPVVDGNVTRVLARIYGVEEPVNESRGKKMIEVLAEESIQTTKHPGVYNQAIMEFGALQCVPRNPDCEVCPFNTICLALANNKVSEIPRKTAKTKVKEIWMYYFFVQNDGKTYIRKRSEKGIWRGLWEFPMIESDKERSETELIAEFNASNPTAKKGEVVSVSESYKHILSHRTIYARFIIIRYKGKRSIAPEGFVEVREESLENYAVPRLIDKFLRKTILA